MKKILRYTVFALVSLICYNAQGQNVWTLDRCIEYAKQHNLQVRQSELSVRQAQNVVTQSKLDFLPNLSAGLSHNMSWGRSVNLQTLEIIKHKQTSNTSASLSSSLTLFDGLSNVYSLKSNQTALQISKLQVEQLCNEITIQITQAYLQLLLSMEIEESALESYKSVENQVDRTAKMVDAGSQAYSTLLEVKSQLATEKSQVVEAKNNVRTNKLTLLQLLDLNSIPIDNFSVEKPLFDFDGQTQLAVPEGVQEIFSKALELPQIKIQELNVQKSEYDYKTAVGRYFPSLSVQAGYGTYYTHGQEGAFFRQFNDNRNPTLGFTLSIPIFSALTTRMNARNQKINWESQKLELQVKKQNLYKEIQSAYNSAYSAYEKMNAAKENLLSIQESFTYTENKFNIGMVNATDYNIAHTNLFRATSAYYQAKYQYIFELKILDFYTGKQITL